MKRTFLALAFVASIFAASCDKRQLNYPTDYFWLNPDTDMMLDSVKQDTVIHVHTDRIWSAEWDTSLEWLTIKGTNGQGNKDVRCHVQANNGQPRAADVTFTIENLRGKTSQRTLRIVQRGPDTGLLPNPGTRLLNR